MNISSFGTTDVGLVRKNNEDAFYIDKNKKLFILADGMGGHNAGEVAAAIAIETTINIFNKGLFSCNNKYLKDKEILLSKSISNGNRDIYLKSLKDAEISGMGTTLEILTFDKENVYVGHIGDSRVYRFRDEKLEQLTKDHSAVFNLVERNLSDKESIKKHPNSHTLINALGINSLVFCDIISDKYKKKDVYLLCSDGLTDVVSDLVIKKLLQEYNYLEEAALALISVAKYQNSRDNITIILLRVD